eukprot:SAG11_NODE_4640_length_1825_cov_0.957706_1_plen_138_part_00
MMPLFGAQNDEDHIQMRNQIDLRDPELREMDEKLEQLLICSGAPAWPRCPFVSSGSAENRVADILEGGARGVRQLVDGRVMHEKRHADDRATINEKAHAAEQSCIKIKAVCQNALLNWRTVTRPVKLIALSSRRLVW